MAVADWLILRLGGVQASTPKKLIEAKCKVPVNITSTSYTFIVQSPSRVAPTREAKLPNGGQPEGRYIPAGIVMLEALDIVPAAF